MMRSPLVCFALVVFSCLWSPVFAETNAPGGEAELKNRLVRSRAVEAVIWAMPAVNYELMLREAFKAGAKENEIVYWSQPVDWHNQTLTPNPDAIYFMTFWNTKEVGPVVIEIPPAGDDGSLTANIDDLWQMALEDAGPSGADKGHGGKYLILPPGYADEVPDGYIVLRPGTYAGYALLRSNLKSHAQADVDKSVAYGKRIKVYPLSKADNPPTTVFTDAKDALFDSTIKYDLSFFTSLDRIIQSEPWLERDKAMIDQLKSIGIEQGQPFNPDADTKDILGQAAMEAHAWLDHQYETIFSPYWGSSRWAVPALPEFVEVSSNGYVDPDNYPVDARAVTYSIGYIGIKRLGAGQFYLITSKDKDGNPLDGGTTYRLHVPPDAPVELYWSGTAYDRETHALIRNMARASRASNSSEVGKNADGSVDIYFGPEAPHGKETNWVPTDPQRQFEVLFRLYRPKQALFDKTWVLPDIEKVE